MDTNRDTPGGALADRSSGPGPAPTLREPSPAEYFATQLAQGHVADAVERANILTPEEAAAALALLPDERAVEILDKPELDDPAEIIHFLPRDRAAVLLEGMSADRVADMLRDLEGTERAALVARLSAEMALAVQRLLSYPPRTAGSIMTTEFVSVPSNWTVAETLAHIRAVERTRETVYAIYVVEPRTRALVRAATMRRLITAEPGDFILSATREAEPVTVTPLTSREEVARLFRRHDLLAVPVVDDAHRILGIVTVDDVLDAIVEEGTEDVQRFGGMEASHEPYTELSFVGMIRKRAGWLCALFLSEMLTASAMQHYEDALERAVVLTLFIPLIMSSGGNSGSQATSLLIRALALGELRLRDWWRVALRELPTGLTLGAILGVIGMARITIWQELGFFDYGEHWVLIALTVGAALVGIVTFGSLAGSMLPFILKRIGFDPASASAPFVATLVDVTGLVIYFSVASAILRGTLL
ncbi:magnesium transporter [Roseomonas gilardii subsp. gilardii]|uniref:magnesium transporter n=1 Tax=Roseomonas gilardii TaxID=257708 RepID=UPI001FF83B0F|nr:magnesium transporter [Roseomonas gilardii]UPG72036.1 magnesium transporter [Roseomonas gilardii subsp. gilardii]